MSGTFSGKRANSVFSASGYNWLITYNGGTGNDVVLTIATALEAWRFAQFGSTANSGTAADNFDANGDGETNLMEFATGQNPNAATAKPGVLVNNGTNLDFTYTRSKPALADGITFAVEWSDTLAAGSWASIGAGTVQTDDGTVQVVKALVPTGSGTRRFVRLKVTKP